MAFSLSYRGLNKKRFEFAHHLSSLLAEERGANGSHEGGGIVPLLHQQVYIYIYIPQDREANHARTHYVQTAAQQATWREWVVETDKVCFGALTRAAAKKVKDHSPATVIPIIFSTGGALRACDNDLLPEPEDRNGRHWMRVELGTILM